MNSLNCILGCELALVVLKGLAMILYFKALSLFLKSLYLFINLFSGA